LFSEWKFQFSLVKGILIKPMYRFLGMSLVSGPLRLAALCLFILALQGCAAMKSIQKFSFFPGVPEAELERNVFSVAKGDDVIGRLAVLKLEKGDTLPDIARHFSLGINAINASNPGVDVWVPRAGERVLLPLSFILPDTPRKGIVINLATMRLFQFKGDGKSQVVLTYPVGIGTEERPSPTGSMLVERKVHRPTWYVPSSIAEDHRKKGDILPAEVPPGPENPLGEYALYLSRPSYLMHGTNKPASIGLRATNGCIRLYPEDVKKLYKDTPVKTSVLIVNQPYLLGQRGGVVYLEAHVPLKGMDADFDGVKAKLKKIEKDSGHGLDWRKVRKTLAEARGIPVPLLDLHTGSKKEVAKPIKVKHPDMLYGRPQPPDLKLDTWYVLAAELRDEIDAKRIAAIINHQGPPIPARVLSKSNKYRVIAGPFDDVSEAKDAVKRLKMDLDIDGILIEPATKG
jgi:L,D-transpeptidase ErfK/SrfK